MKTRFLTATLGAFLVLGISAPAAAHGSMKPSHGGIVQLSGEIMVELADSPGGLAFYVTEEDEPLPAASFDARMIVTTQSGQKTTTVLTPGSDNCFTAPGLKAEKGSKVVVALVGKADAAKTFVTFQLD